MLNTFDLPTRMGARSSLVGFGDGLAGRGVDLNEAIALLPPLLDNLQPVAVNLSAPRTRLARFFPALERAAARSSRRSPRRRPSCSRNLDTTFTALASSRARSSRRRSRSRRPR